MSFKMCLYVEAPGVDLLHRNPSQRPSFTNLIRKVGFDKVYFDAIRGAEGGGRNAGLVISEEALTALRDWTLTFGAQPCAGVAYGTRIPNLDEGAIGPDGMEIETFPCISSPKTINLYTDVAHTVASVFDELLVDDVIYNYCFCDRCIGLFNELNKTQLTRKEIVAGLRSDNKEITRMWCMHSGTVLNNLMSQVVKTCRTTNPKMQVNWKILIGNREFSFLGLHDEGALSQFDRIDVGVEMREINEMPAAGYLNYRFVRDRLGKQVRGAWFDVLNGYNWHEAAHAECFRRQLHGAVLDHPEQITIWSYPEIGRQSCGKLVNVLATEVPYLKTVHDQLSEQTGVPIRRDKHFYHISSPESYMDWHFISTGVTTRYVPSDADVNSPVEILNVYSDEVDVKNLLGKGKTLLVSSEAALHLIENGQAELLGVDKNNPIKSEAAIVRYFEDKDGKAYEVTSGIENRIAAPAGPALNVDDGLVTMWAVTSRDRFPAIFEKSHGKGKIITFCLTLFPPYYKYNYPEYIRQMWRDYAGEILGVKIENPKDQYALPGVILIPTDKAIVLWNTAAFYAHVIFGENPEILGGTLTYDAKWSKLADDGSWKRAQTILAPQELRIMNIDKK